MRRTLPLIATLLVWALLTSPGLAQTLDEGLARLSDQIASEMSASKKHKVAVIEFSDLDGKVTEFGKYLSEELITRLFATKKFNVVERQLLNKILEEHALTLTGVVDESTAIELGKILGLDAICSGTITDLVDAVKVNARLISTETGSLFAVASAQFHKDEVITQLMGKVSYVTVTTAAGTTEKTALTGKIVFHEDFSSVEEGTAPSRWIGTEHVMVQLSGEQKCLTNFEKGDSKLIIPNILFPEDFRIEWHCRYAPGRSVGDCETEFELIAGSVVVGLKNRYYRDHRAWINQTYAKFPKFNDKTLLACLEKRGEVFRLFIDGKPIVLTRVAKYENPRALVLDFHGYRFRLYRISVSSI